MFKMWFLKVLEKSLNFVVGKMYEPCISFRSDFLQIMKTEYTSLELLNQTLSAGGLNNAATDEERLQQLWQLYIKSQVDTIII